jgi:plastocyanin
MVKSLAVVAAACCSLAGTARAAEVFVTVSTTSNTYSPQVVFIQPGDTVTWTYAGGPMPHDVHADDNSYFNTLSAAPWTFSHTFPVATTSRYYCTAHGAPGGVGMSGVVVVGGRAAWTPSDIAYTINAWDFSPRLSTMATGSPAAPELHRSGTGVELIAGVRLPAGALVTGLELAACTGAGSIQATLEQCLDPDGACDPLATVNTTGIPACGFTSAPVSGVNADNLNFSYAVRVLLTGNQSLRSVRVFYRKVVSPPPATPTFADVPPSDPRYRFVEALAAAGITGGCGGGNYCPDAALTRGQMAVFLSAALGLYWPN